MAQKGLQFSLFFCNPRDVEGTGLPGGESTAIYFPKRTPTWLAPFFLDLLQVGSNSPWKAMMNWWSADNHALSDSMHLGGNLMLVLC